MIYYFELDLYLKKIYVKGQVHVIIVVKLDGKQYMVDAGTTRFLSQPLEITLDKIQKTKFGTYRFVKHDESSEFIRLQRSKNVPEGTSLEFENQIRFNPNDPKDFEGLRELNEYVQTEMHPMIFFR